MVSRSEIIRRRLRSRPPENFVQLKFGTGGGGIGGIQPEEEDVALIGVTALPATAISPDQEGTYHTAGGFPTPFFRVPVPRPGTLSNFRVFVASNTNDVSLVVDVLVDGAMVMTLTVPAFATGKFGPVAGPIAVAAGGGVSFRNRATGTSGNSLIAASVEYQPD